MLYPNPAIEEGCVMKAVYAIKADGSRREAEDLLFTAGAHLEQKGAEVLVLGCTEIPLAFNPKRATVPVINATRILAEAACREFSRPAR